MDAKLVLPVDIVLLLCLATAIFYSFDGSFSDFISSRSRNKLGVFITQFDMLGFKHFILFECKMKKKKSNKRQNSFLFNLSDHM